MKGKNASLAFLKREEFLTNEIFLFFHTTSGHETMNSCYSHRSSPAQSDAEIKPSSAPE